MGTTVNRRKIWIVALGTCLLVLFAVLATLNAFNTQLPKPATTQQIVVFTGLSIVAFLLFVAVLVLLVRNVLKLYADQRSRVMGTRLRTRMLWGAVLVSLVPIASMFAFSYQLMNRSVDRWFSQPATEVRDDSNNMALELARYTSANARAEADSIASGLPDPSIATSAAKNPATPKSASRQGRVRGSIHTSMRNSSSHSSSVSFHQDREAIYQVLRQHEITLQNGFAIVYREGRVIASFHMPQRAGATAEVKTWLPDQVAEEDAADASAHAPTDPTDVAILSAAQRND
jgi:two-component system, NtrC family, nitrogen regulation sensor histidine kinase NtrY